MFTTRLYISLSISFRRRYSFKADVWALGVLIYLMLYGRYPFDGNNTSAIVVSCSVVSFASWLTSHYSDLQKVICSKKVEWQVGDIRVSDRAISFMKMLLHRNPDKRPTAAEGKSSYYSLTTSILPIAAQHEWLAGARKRHESMDQAGLLPKLVSQRRPSERSSGGGSKQFEAAADGATSKGKQSAALKNRYSRQDTA